MTNSREQHDKDGLSFLVVSMKDQCPFRHGPGSNASLMLPKTRKNDVFSMSGLDSGVLKRIAGSSGPDVPKTSRFRCADNYGGVAIRREGLLSRLGALSPENELQCRFVDDVVVLGHLDSPGGSKVREMAGC